MHAHSICGIAAVLLVSHARDVLNRPMTFQPPLFTTRDTLREELPPGKNRIVLLVVKSNEYMRLAVSSWDAGIAVEVFGPTGARVLADPLIEENPTYLSWVGTATGRYSVRIYSDKNGLTLAKFELRIDEKRPAVESDRNRILAEQNCREAAILQKRWTPNSDKRAIAILNAALRLSISIGDVACAARTRRRIGDLLQDRSRFSEALAQYEQSLQMSQRSGDSRGVADTLSRIGRVRAYTVGGQRALGLLEKALRISGEIGDERGTAIALAYTGDAYYLMGNQREALNYYLQAVQRWRIVGEWRGLAMTLLSLGAARSDLRDVQSAFQDYNQALHLWRAIRDRHGEAVTLTLLGALYGHVGEPQEAINRYRQAELIFQNGGDPLAEASLMDKFAYAYYRLGYPEASMDYSLKALALYQKADFREGIAGALSKIGRIHYECSEYQTALEYLEKSLLLYQQVQDQLLQGVLLCEIGKVRRSVGELQRAIVSLDKALGILRNAQHPKGQADALNELGLAYRQRQDIAKALECFQEALRLNRESQDRFGEVQTRGNLARVLWDLGNSTDSLAQIQESIEIIESLRTKVAVSSLRMSYFSTIRQNYELYIDCLMDQHRDKPAEGQNGVALHVSEHVRARNLLDILQESRAAIRQSIDPSLAAREKEVLRSLNAAAQRQDQLMAGKHSQEEADGLAAQIRSLEIEYDQLQAEIRIRNNRYTELTHLEPLGLKEIQERVLDEGTVLLEYSLGDERSWLWAVSKTKLASFELPPRQKIEALASEVRKLLVARQLHPPGETASQFRKRVQENDAHYWKSAAELSRLLVSPASPILKDHRLLVVADGLLQYLPFAALPQPDNNRGSEAAPTPLAVEHEIVNLASASMLDVLRRQNVGRKAVEKSVAVFADPVYQRDDPRLSAAASAQARRKTRLETPRGGLSGSGAGVTDTYSGLRGGQAYARLVFSGREADDVFSTAGPGSSIRWLGVEASRERAMSQELSRYQIIHFATHGETNDLHPSLSGLLLSTRDAEGRERYGFLRLPDIYNLNLPAELVVLSACNTGLGRSVRGEGLIGLVRGFMYAGAARVVASLWAVDDESTAELMKRFYRGMLQEGLSPASALRTAQVEMSKHPRWSAPYYWSGFVLQGEYK